MEGVNQKSLERVVSQRALQMGSSFPCQICVVGLLCGICLTSLFLAALTSFGTFQFGAILFSSMSLDNSTSQNNTNNCNSKIKETQRLLDLKSSREGDNDDIILLLYSAWSAVLNKSTAGDNEYLYKLGIKGSNLPNLVQYSTKLHLAFHEAVPLLPAEFVFPFSTLFHCRAVPFPVELFLSSCSTTLNPFHLLSGVLGDRSGIGS